MTFSVEKWEEDGRLLVKQDETGWFFPVESEIQASTLCAKFNEIETVERPLDLHKDFQDYDNLITKMNKQARLLVEKETKRQVESDNLLAEAREIKYKTGKDIIKEKYGANNDKIRKQYVDETLKSLADEIQELKFQKDENNRQLGFLKRLIDMKTAIIKYGEGE